jgi:hypothetical protein
MLTRPAQTVWIRERVQSSPELADYPCPDFEAIYVPSDIRWSYELDSVEAELKQAGILPQLVQRAAVGISALMEATRTFQQILADGEKQPEPFLRAFIRHFQFGPTAPSFAEVRLRLLSWAEEIHSLLASQRTSELEARINSLPPSLTGHAIDVLTRACMLFEEYVDVIAPKKWALCFDEMEISPRWLQAELLSALRSFDQHFLLKLTWSPILPTDLIHHQERQHDYAVVRMWHAHAAEARPFAQQFSTRVLRDRLSDSQVTPFDVFGVSPFAQDESLEEDIDPYGEGTAVWKSMVSLAAKDRSFREYLAESGLDPDNPVTENPRIRDEVLRKVKPIVLLRDTYLRDRPGGASRRSRKGAPLYFGEDAVYAMSEGNPRMLAGLLNELLDAETRPNVATGPRIRPEVQSRVLLAASQRMLSGIKTYPVGPEVRSTSLVRLVDLLGDYLKAEFAGPTFKADPVGSFMVDQDVPSDMLETIRIGLLIGAFVYVGSTLSDVPVSALGARIRLSHMLAPTYTLLFRNYREIRLSTALRISSSSQRSMFWAT